MTPLSDPSISTRKNFKRGNPSIQPEVVIVGHLLLNPVRLKTVNKKSPGKKKVLGTIHSEMDCPNKRVVVTKLG